MKYNAKEILENLNLDEYFLHLDFEFLPKESSKKWRIYQNPKDGCKYLVSNNKTTSHFFYKNTQGLDNSFKNVIDFVREHDQEVLSFGGSKLEKDYLIIKKLNDYLSPGTQNDVKKSEAVLKFNKKIEKKERLAKTTEFNKTPIFDYTYLVKTRKIDKQTIDHKLIKPTVFNTIFQFGNGHQNVNTAFAKFDNDQIPAMEVYYESSTKSNSLVIGKNDIPNYDQYLWHSVIDNTKPFSHIIFSESAKDAVSYFELMLKGPDAELDSFNPLLISIGGNLDSENLKKKQLQNIIEQGDYSKAKFYSIADNDKAGNKYDIHFIETTHNLFFKETISVLEKHNFLEIQFPKDILSDEWQNEINQINKEVESHLNTKDNFGKFFILKTNEDKILMPADTSNYPYHQQFIKLYNKLVLSPFNKKFISHKPKMKELNGDLDWNAFLMYKKDKTYFLKRQQRHLEAKIKRKSRVLSKTNKAEKKKEITI